MRPVGVTVGVLLVIMGTTAAISREFSDHASWIVASGLAVVGFAGLVAAATALTR